MAPARHGSARLLSHRGSDITGLAFDFDVPVRELAVLEPDFPSAASYRRIAASLSGAKRPCLAGSWK
jgi:hypothetical protein